MSYVIFYEENEEYVRSFDQEWIKENEYDEPSRAVHNVKWTSSSKKALRFEHKDEAFAISIEIDQHIVGATCVMKEVSDGDNREMKRVF